MTVNDDNISPESVKVQLEEAFNIYRLSFTIITQVIAFLVTANIAIVGFAMNSKNLGLILICAFFL